ncbi:DNA 5'-adenosine monophosphate hydrolase [Kluyveromyces lactis]|uniref:KLLA0C09625p n=1 Tax=Kluyveromyces lactis (strain ATCC 8585 / CBS 2359 / DSM 70799 / NBRC 1267 / NRRL Y-1140 / WM37) TaxID=284590 RepID=Q6CTW2_KLULA|nr:uncharacterized protein KLLA0_C09625g [Kluyveromyces lactis]CAH01478.1 KLLA0C09625p [Kluyveromyces lactis]|eukprot:XP_452627.1 uncharacterized protein KLLA0_C09625g [Kluyveromyces lactis]
MDECGPIYVIEWKESPGDQWTISDKSGFTTHLFKLNEDANKDIVYCKHCRKQFIGKNRDLIGFHMNKIHPQITTGMTYNQYLQIFKPTYVPNAHGDEKNRENSFSIGLRPYVLCPERLPEVLYFDDIATIIHDKFPKSEEHFLVLPRSHKISNSHPTTIDNGIKVQLQWHIDWAKRFCWTQFIKKYDIKDISLKEKEAFLANFVQSGVHSTPSMANTHIHVMTRDFHSKKLKHKKHFNSFNSPFFIPWDELPVLDLPGDKELSERYIKNFEMICPYCSTNFKNRFAKLKEHLADEFNMRFVSKKGLITADRAISSFNRFTNDS